MKRNIWLALSLFILGTQQSFAAGQHAGHLTPQLQLGRRLFEQSCGICHTRPTLVAGMFGPELSKNTMGGSDEVLRVIIANGTQRMPGFKYMFTPEQIAAIASYVKTLPPGNQDSPAAPPPAKAAPVSVDR